MYWLVVLYFTSGIGLGEPPMVTLPTHYPTLQACKDAAAVWMSAASNPTKAVRQANCGSRFGK
ncbi:MAG: hypothetical protein JWP25_8965 [Bradyrhizobium sp.]|nr:hypothetical protein [Bradyrhizobium sp.]